MTEVPESCVHCGGEVDSRHEAVVMPGGVLVVGCPLYSSDGWEKITIPVKDAPPLTLESLQRTFDHIKAQCGRYEPPMRFFSAQAFARAKEAEARGASRAEIEWVLLGASLAQAKEWAGER